MKQSELDFFRPLWRRLLVTAFIGAWFAWEALWNQEQLWVLITGAALAYAVWNLFIRFDANDAGPAAPAAGSEQREGGRDDDARPEA